MTRRASHDLWGGLLHRLEQAGLPIEGGIVPNAIGTLCPMCRAGMRVDRLDGPTGDRARFICHAGCAEADVVATIGGRR